MKKFIVLVVVVVIALCMTSIVSARSAGVIKVTSEHGFKYQWDNIGGVIPKYLGNNTWKFSSDYNSSIDGDMELFFKIYPCLEIDKILYSDEKIRIIRVRGMMTI